MQRASGTKPSIYGLPFEVVRPWCCTSTRACYRAVPEAPPTIISTTPSFSLSRGPHVLYLGQVSCFGFRKDPLRPSDQNKKNQVFSLWSDLVVIIPHLRVGFSSGRGWKEPLQCHSATAIFRVRREMHVVFSSEWHMLTDTSGGSLRVTNANSWGYNSAVRSLRSKLIFIF